MDNGQRTIFFSSLLFLVLLSFYFLLTVFTIFAIFVYIFYISIYIVFYILYCLCTYICHGALWRIKITTEAGLYDDTGLKLKYNELIQRTLNDWCFVVVVQLGILENFGGALRQSIN